MGSISQVWSTSYGRVLIVKSVLLLPLLGLGWLNRTRLLDAFTRLRRSATVEAATASAPPPAGGPANLELEGGGKLALWPGTAGRNLVAVRTTGHPKQVRVDVRSQGGTTATAERACMWEIA